VVYDARGDRYLVSNLNGIRCRESSPADIAFDSKRSRLLVPHLVQGVIDAFEVR